MKKIEGQVPLAHEQLLGASTEFATTKPTWQGTMKVAAVLLQ